MPISRMGALPAAFAQDLAERTRQRTIEPRIGLESPDRQLFARLPDGRSKRTPRLLGPDQNDAIGKRVEVDDDTGTREALTGDREQEAVDRLRRVLRSVTEGRGWSEQMQR